MELRRGQRSAVIGPSGSGKTTLLALAAGLDLPSAGEVRVCGQALSSMSEDERAVLRNREVGFVFQSFQLIPSLTALENAMLPAEFLGTPWAEAREHARELLSYVGLSEREHHYPAQLSGGEQQRVAIARALINAPRLVFADEPTGNLDADNAAHVLELLFKLNAERGTALLFVTHDLQIASSFPSRLQLRHGEVVA